MEKQKIKLNNPFADDRPFPVVEFTEREYIHYVEVEEVSKDFDPKKPSEFLIEKHIEEYERIPIDEFIESQSSKVGLKNELKGIVSKQQMDEYILTHKAKPGFVDLTKLPDSVLEMGEFAVKLNDIWESIPKELRGDLSKEEFLKTYSAEKLDSYVRSKLPKEEKKGENE